MAFLDTPEPTPPRVSPQFLVGAASPLWGYFSAVAAGGMAYWWMTQWARPVNLEALFDMATKTPAPAVEAIAATEAVVKTAIEAVAEVIPEPPAALVGGESAPLGIEILEVAPEIAPEPELPEPILEASPEPVLEAAPEPVFEAEPTVEAPVEAAAEPVIEAAPAPKPKAKKPPVGQSPEA